jgi:hypothetical protein
MREASQHNMRDALRAALRAALHALRVGFLCRVFFWPVFLTKSKLIPEATRDVSEKWGQKNEKMKAGGLWRDRPFRAWGYLRDLNPALCAGLD